jgi:hypothetical protein
MSDRELPERPSDTEAHGSEALECLRRAVAEALDRKRRLGQHAIVWRNGRIVRLRPDELPVFSPMTRSAT